MIIVDHLNLIYIAVPKTGSATIQNVLRNEFNGKRINRDLPGINNHRRVIPKEYREYMRVASIRHPYSRTVSQFTYGYNKNKLENIQVKFGVKVQNFNHFLDFCLDINSKYDCSELDHDICGWFSCSKFLKLCGYDKVIRQEYLQQDFSQIVGTNVELSKLNSTINDIKLTDDQKK